MPISTSPNSREHSFESFEERSAEHGFESFEERSAEHGFTLVELMVVLVLIGLAGSLVMLAARGPGAVAGDEAARLALRIAGARDRAIIDGRSTRVEFLADGYRFAQRVRGEWSPVAGRGLKPARLPDTVSLAANSPALTFDSGGLPDAPAEASVSAADSHVRVRVDAVGGVDVLR